MFAGALAGLIFHDNPVCGGLERVGERKEKKKKTRHETVGLKTSGLSYSYKLTIAPCDHMILLISSAATIIRAK